jgi:glycosyltransferase domain-containing protein
VKENITVIIPTHNFRFNLVQRLLDYYKGFSLQIIIEDGSKKKLKKRFSENINYFHFPKKDFISRIIHAIEHSRTKYVAINQDDDFLIYSSLIKAKKYLDSNKEYSFISGKIFNFEDYLESTFFKETYSPSSIGSIKSKNNFNRLLMFSNKAPMLVASLFKKKDLLKILYRYQKFQKKISLEKKDLFNELAFSLFMFSEFNYKYLDIVWQLRDRNVYPFQKKSNFTKLNRPLESLEANLNNPIYSSLSKEIKKLYKFEKNLDFEILLIDVLKKFNSKKNQFLIMLDYYKDKIKFLFPGLFKILKLISKFFRLFLLNRSESLRFKHEIARKINKNEYIKFFYVVKKHRLSINKLINTN